MPRRVLALLSLVPLLAVPAFAGTAVTLPLSGDSPAGAVWVNVAPEDWVLDSSGNGYRLSVGLSTSGLADGAGVTAVGIFYEWNGRLDGSVYAHTGDFGGFTYHPWSPEPVATRYLVVAGRDGAADGDVTVRAPGAAPLDWDVTGVGTRAGSVLRWVHEGEVLHERSSGMTYEIVPPDPAAGRLFETVRFGYDHPVSTRSIHVAELRSLAKGTTATVEGSYAFDDRSGEDYAVYSNGYGQAFYLLGDVVDERASAEMVVRTTPRADSYDWADVATIPVDPAALGVRGPYESRFGGVDGWILPADEMRCVARAPDGPDAWVDCAPAQV